MAKIKIISDRPLIDGMTVAFRAPCDCSAVDGLTVYYLGESENFTFQDAHGNALAGLGNLFSQDSLVKAVLDVTNKKAYLQNADTNAYLEGRFNEKLSKCISVTTGGSNLNDYVDDGIWFFDSVVNDSGSVVPQNSPEGFNGGWLHVIKGTYIGIPSVKQIWYNAGVFYNPDTYVRTYYRGEWSAWKKYAMEADASAIVKLWENASVSSTFEPQTISLDLSSYDMILVRARLHTNTSYLCPLLMIDVGGNKGLLYGNPYVRIARRIVQAKTNGVTFDDGVYFENYGDATAKTQNDYLIPVSIHGVKEASNVLRIVS